MADGLPADGLLADGLLADGLPADGLDGFLSAGLISGLGLLTDCLPAGCVDLDVEDEREFPRDCASRSNWKAVNANPISIAAKVFADNLITIGF